MTAGHCGSAVILGAMTGLAAWRNVQRWMLLLAGLLAGLGPAAAGTLTRAGVQALFPPPLVVGERSADLPAWPIFQRTGAGLQLQAHAFETIDLEPVAGYGGRPVNLLVVLDAAGRFQQVRLIGHAEPLFTSPAGTATLATFAQQYEGLTLDHQVVLLSPRAERRVSDTTAGLHGVLTGTVSALAIDKAVLESAARVARARAGGASASAGSDGPDDRYSRSGWTALAAAGLVQPWRLTNRQVQALFQGGPAAARDPAALAWADGPAVDLWLAAPGLPQAGRNLLDVPAWRQVRAAREAGRTLLLVIDGGRYPVMAGAAPGEARAAVLQLRQQGRSFSLQPLPLSGGLALRGARSGVAGDAVPRLFEVLPAADGTTPDITRPFALDLAIQRGAMADAPPVRHAVQRPFSIPDVQRWQPQAEPPAWLATLRSGIAQRGADLAVLALALAVLTVALLNQRRLTARPGWLTRFRTGWLVFTLGFIGWWAQGQLSVVSITAAVEAGVAGRSLSFLLADPVALLLWAFTGATLLVWGRGTFCGWLCPFGALQELSGRVAMVLGWRQRRLHRRTDQRLKWLKYAVLALLCGGAAAGAGWTDAAVEVEPFKTAISQHFQRDWHWVLWALACVAAGVAVHRGYCRYLCPLGAALAIAGRLRRWRWIPRRAECGTPCQTCRHRCGYQAITPAGAVQYDECFQCLDCVAIHQDPRQCLPLLQARPAGQRVVPIMPAGELGR